jgi:hypothetical protein
MATAKQAVQFLSQVSTSGDRLATDDFSHEDGVANERSRVASYQFDRAVTAKDGDTFDLDIVAYESTSADGTAGNQETVNLSHDIVTSDSIPEDVVVFEGTNELAVDSVDYANDTIDVTPANANSTLHMFYAAGDQAHVEVEKTSPGGTSERLDEADIGLVNQRDQSKTPLRFDFQHPLQGVIPQDWTLEIYVDAPYTVAWTAEGGDVEPPNQLFSIPLERSEQVIPEEIEDAIAAVAATR